MSVSIKAQGSLFLRGWDVGKLRQIFAVLAAFSLSATLIPGTPIPASATPDLAKLNPVSTSQDRAPFEPCAGKVVDALNCDPNHETLIPSDAKNYPQVAATVSGTIFKHSGGRRGVMEKSWGFRGWKQDQVPGDTPLGGVTVYARWYDGTTPNGAWSPRFSATSQADGSYTIALRPFVDERGVTHTFKGTGSLGTSPKNQLLRLGIRSDKHQLVWMPNNGSPISRAVVAAGLADNVSWGENVTGYNFALADKDFKGPGQSGVKVTQKTGGKPGSCAPSLAANFYRISGRVFWDYAQNKLQDFDASPVDGKTYTAQIDWQPIIQSKRGDTPVKGQDLKYYVVAWVPDDRDGNNYEWAHPKTAVVGWAPVDNNGVYTVFVDGTGEFSLITRNNRLNHIMLQLVKSTGGEPQLEGNVLKNVVPVDTKYGFWNPTAGQFRSWTDTGISETGTGLKQKLEGPCGSHGYSVLYNANFAMFPWQAKLESSLDGKTWSHHTTAIRKDALQLKVTGLAPLSEYRLIADQSTLLVDKFTTNEEGNWSGSTNLTAFATATWENTEHSLNVVLPGVERIDLAKSPIVATSNLRLVPYRVDTSPQELTVNETVASGKQFKVEGATVQSCAWGQPAPEGLSVAPNAAGTACVISGSPAKSGNTPVVLQVKTDVDATPTSWNALLRIHPKILAQQQGATAGENESPVPSFAGVGQQFLGQVAIARDKSNRLMQLTVQQGGATLPEKNGMFDLGHGLKLIAGSGQIIGTPTLEAGQDTFDVKFQVSVVDQDGLVGREGSNPQNPVPFTINIATPIRLIEPHLPSVIAGQSLQNPDGSPVKLWVKGGKPSGTTGGNAPTNTYQAVQLVTSSGSGPIPDVEQFKALGFHATPEGTSGSQVLQISGTAGEVTAPTVLYLPVKITDNTRRYLDGSERYTLPQIKASSAQLSGAEGWARLLVLPKIQGKAFKDGVVGQPYPANSIADALESAGLGTRVRIEGSDYTYAWDNYTFSAAGLPAGLRMEPDGTITGTPHESTPPEGQEITVSLSGKTGTLAQKVSATVTARLKVKSSFRVATRSVSAVAQGGVTYTADKSLKTTTGKDLPGTINPTGGQAPYSYRLQVKQNGNWEDAQSHNGRYQIPNLDGSPSGLLLGPAGNILGSTLGSAAFPELQVIVSDSDLRSCSPAGAGSKVACSETVALHLTREDGRKPVISVAKVVVDLKNPGGGRLAIAEGSGQYTQVVLQSNAGKFPANLRFRVTGTPSGGGSAVTKDLSQSSGTEFSVGDGHAPHEFTFQSVLGGDKPKVGVYPGAFTMKAKDLNGNWSEIRTLAVEVSDTRQPQPAPSFPGQNPGPEEGRSLQQKAAQHQAGAYFDPASADIACYVPQKWDAAQGCPSKAQALPEAPGVTLEPNGRFSGVPHKGTTGEKNVAVRAISKTGAVSYPVTIPLVIAPSTLEFRPGTPVGGVKDEAEYTWEFPPASGGADTKHYRLVDSGGNPVPDCTVQSSSADKAQLRCKTASIQDKTGLSLEVYTQDGGAETRITRRAAVEFRFVDALKIVPRPIPGGAEGARYADSDGSTFRFQVSGGLGPYVFGFAEGSPHQKAASPDACNGWKLFSQAGTMLGGAGVDTGLCLTEDGTITGTAASGSAGDVDLSGLMVTDSLHRKAKLTGQYKGFQIATKLSIESDYSSADKSLRREKNQILGEDGQSCTDPGACKVKVATITGGARPFKEIKLLGLGQFVNLGAGKEDRLILQRDGDTWSGSLTGVAQSGGKASGTLTVSVRGSGDGPLEVYFVGSFSKISEAGLSATLKVTGGSDQETTASIFVQVDTDLKFINPEGAPAGTVALEPAPGAGGTISKPSSLKDVTGDEWDSISGKLDKDLPTIGLGLDKKTVTEAKGEGLVIPQLVEGGVKPFHFTTEPCDVKGENPKKSGQMDCAIGDTGLFLDYDTGEVYGTPKPGAKLTAVVIVVDSDQPPQHKRANLVVSVADPRKPNVSAGQVLQADKKNPTGEAVVALQDGSGKYQACQVAAVKPAIGIPAWLRAELNDGVCKLKWTGMPADAAKSYQVTVKVQDANGNWNTSDGTANGAVLEQPVQTVTLQVADTRPPVIPDIDATINVTEGEELAANAFPVLKTGEQARGPAISKWTVTGLPDGLSFDEDTGKVIGYPRDGQVGNFHVTITATGANGVTATKTVTVTVADSGLRIIPPAIPTPTGGQPFSVPDRLSAVFGAAGTPCAKCTFSRKDSGGILTVAKDGTISLKDGLNAWPTDPGKESDTLTIVATNERGITAELTLTISANGKLDLSPKALPVVYAGESLTQCFHPSGGDSSQGYRIAITNNAGIGYSITSNDQVNGYCVKFSPDGNTPAGVKVLTATVKDIAGNNMPQEVRLQLPVRVHRTLSVNSSEVTVTKGENVAVNATLNGGDCYPKYDGDSVTCEEATVKWEIVDSPEGLTITGNGDSATISGTPSQLFDGDVTIRVTRKHSSGDKHNTASFHLKVNTDLQVSAPTGTSVTTQEDGTVKITGGATGKETQLLEDKTTAVPGESTGKYSIPGVSSDGNGNYPIKVDGKETGLALTPEGKLVGTLNPGIVTDPSGTTVTFPVVLTETDDQGNSSTSPEKTVSFTLHDTRKPEMAATTVTGRVGEAASGTLPGVDKSSETGKPKYSSLSCTGVAPHAPNAPTTNDFTVAENGTWTIAPGFVPSKTDNTGKATWACTVTVTAANGQTIAGKFTLEMRDYRTPKFQKDRQRYVWEGRNIPPFELRGTWITNPATDPSVPPLKTISVQNLPLGMKVVKDGGEEWESSEVTIPGTGTNGQSTSRKTRRWTCNLTGAANEKCQITGWPQQNTAGQYVLTVEATGTNGVKATDYPVVMNYGAALKLGPTPGATPYAKVGETYSQAVAIADYLRPLDLSDDQVYNGTSGTSAGGTGGSTPAQNTAEAWQNTWALDGAASVKVADADGESGWNATLEDNGEAISACAQTQGTCAASLVKKQIKLSRDAAFTADQVGAHNLVLKLTDGHGMKRSLAVSVNVYAPLQWAAAPFKTPAETAVLNPQKGMTAGQPFRDESGAVIYAEATGGNASDYNSILAATDTTLTRENSNPKATVGYAGIQPIWCQAQITAGLSSTRAKCFPVPGLVPGTPTGTKDHPYSGEGVFLLSNGKFVGTVPAGTNAGVHEAQVAVVDANGEVISKKFSVQVYAPLQRTGGIHEPSGTQRQSYGPFEMFSVTGGSSNYECSYTPTVPGLVCTVKGGAVKLSGTPETTFAGKITVTVRDTKDPSRAVSENVGLTIVTDLRFENPPSGVMPDGSTVSVDPNSANGTQTLKITTSGNGQPLNGEIPLHVTGGDVTAGALPGTPAGHVFHLTDKDGNPITGAPCIDDTKTAADESKITDTNGIYERLCYPVGNTGLQLTSDGKLIGTPIPGTKSDNFVVVADQAQPPNTKSAQLNIVIRDYRQPQAYPLKLASSVGTAQLSGQVTHDEFVNPTGATPSDTYDTAQQAAAAADKQGFYSAFPEEAWTKTHTPETAQQCPAGVGSIPDWLTLGRDGQISLASGNTVPPWTETRPTTGGQQAVANHEYRFCVWYVGANGMASHPTVISVSVTDNRNATPDAANGTASKQNVTPGTPVTKTDTRNVMRWTIPADLLKHSGDNITKTNDRFENGKSIYFTTTPTGYTDTEIPGLKGVGECSAGANGTRNCEFWVEGTPKPAAAGQTYNLSYTLTLANNQTLVIAKEVTVAAYELEISAGAMPVAWVGEPYLPGDIRVTGGSTENTISVSGEISAITGYDPATGRFMTGTGTPGTPGTGGTGSTNVWAPSDADAREAGRRAPFPGYLELTLRVTDKAACRTWESTREVCPYFRETTVRIPIAKRPSEAPLEGGEIWQGAPWNSAPLVDSPNLSQQPGLIQEIIAAQNDTGHAIPPGGITVEGNQLRVSGEVPPGRYTVSVKTTVTGFGTFIRVVNFTVKERAARLPAVTPTPTPTSTGTVPPPERDNSSPQGGDLAAPSGNFSAPSDTSPGLPLIVRHGGVNREATALSVLDYFDGQHTGAVFQNRYIAAYPEYEERSHADWSDTAVLVRDDDYADSLVSGPLAAELNAPILLTPSQAMNIKTLNQLVQRGFKRVVIVGNTAAVSGRVAQTITAAGFQVERLGGNTRYATATAVADRILQIRGAHNSTVLLATGKNYPDALTASAAAIKQRGVVLLTPRSQADAETKTWMKSTKSSDRHAIGGPAVRASDHYGVPIAKKVMGQNRYQTAAAVAQTFFPPGPARVVVATGRDFPDATVATAITAKTGAPVTLTPAYRLAPVTGKYLQASKNSIRKIDVLGGNAAVNPRVEAEIKAAVTGR